MEERICQAVNYDQAALQFTNNEILTLKIANATLYETKRKEVEALEFRWKTQTWIGVIIVLHYEGSQHPRHFFMFFHFVR